MPNRCCVFSCTGNYRKKEKVSVFSFPKDEELRYKWVRAIRRKGFNPSKSSRVCEVHFRPEEIEKITSMYDPRNGKLLTAPLGYPRLVKGAVPSQFLGLPLDLSKSRKIHCEDLEKEHLKLENEMLSQAISESNYTKTDLVFSHFQRMKNLDINGSGPFTEKGLIRQNHPRSVKFISDQRKVCEAVASRFLALVVDLSKSQKTHCECLEKERLKLENEILSQASGESVCVE